MQKTPVTKSRFLDTDDIKRISTGGNVTIEQGLIIPVTAKDIVVDEEKGTATYYCTKDKRKVSKKSPYNVGDILFIKEAYARSEYARAKNQCRYCTVSGECTPARKYCFLADQTEIEYKLWRQVGDRRQSRFYAKIISRKLEPPCPCRIAGRWLWKYELERVELDDN